MLYEEWFHCFDLGTQLVGVIDRFHASAACASGEPAADYASQPPRMHIDTETVVAAPVPLAAWIAGTARPAGGAVLWGAGAAERAHAGREYRIELHTRSGAAGGGWGSVVMAAGGGDSGWRHADAGELFVYAMAGSAAITLRRRADGAEHRTELPAESMLIVPGGGAFDVLLELGAEPDVACMVVTNAALPGGSLAPAA